jgi:hypothetical protein
MTIIIHLIGAHKFKNNNNNKYNAILITILLLAATICHRLLLTRMTAQMTRQISPITAPTLYAPHAQMRHHSAIACHLIRSIRPTHHHHHHTTLVATIFYKTLQMKLPIIHILI